MAKVKIWDNVKGLFKGDGWVNVLAGLSGSSDKSQKTYFGSYTMLDDNQLTNLWMGEGLGKKIVSVVADDMTRNWFRIDGDEEHQIRNEMERLKAETRINTALKWARLYRGAVVVMGLEDGGELNEPANLKSVSGIRWLKVYSASRIKLSTSNIVDDPKSPFFGEVEVFPIQKINGEPMDVHRSRCLIFRGDPIPDHTQSQQLTFDNYYWGLSIFQSIYQRLKNLGGVEQSVVNLMYEAIIGKFTLSGLAEILSSNNTAAVYRRMEIINASKSLLNSVLLGENERYERDAANLSGIPEIMDRFMMMLSAVAEIPVTKLFGRAPAGMNATGESDTRNYYDMVTSKQKTWMKPGLQYLVSIVNSYMKATKEPAINFNSVWEPTQKEQIEMHKQQAETDAIYLDRGVLDPNEVRENRFVNGYSYETTVDDADGLPDKKKLTGKAPGKPEAETGV